MSLIIDDYSDIETIISVARLTLRQAREEKSEDLFILNTCDMGGRKQKGDVRIKIAVGGRLVPVKIPDTVIPWDMTRYTTKDTWLKDPEFTNLIELRVLTIIDSEVAKQILNTPEAEYESEKLHQREQDLLYGIPDVEEANAKRIEDNRNRDKVHALNDRNKRVKEVEVTSFSRTEANSNVRLISIMNNNLDEMSRLNALINIKKELKPEDYDYIMNRLAPSETKIKDWVIKNKRR